MSQREIQCLCEEVFEVDAPETQELSSSLIEDILSGRFQSFVCPACGNRVNVELPVRLSSPSWKLELDFFPEVERNHFLAGSLKTATSQDRIAFGLKELAEKVRIYRDGLDDKAVEALKFSFLQRGNYGDEVRIYYFQKRDGKLEFYLEGLKENEIGMTGVQESFYEKLQARVADPPEDWKAFLTPPYVNAQSVRSAEKEA